jgi:hypothetical protein
MKARSRVAAGTIAGLLLVGGLSVALIEKSRHDGPGFQLTRSDPMILVAGPSDGGMLALSRTRLVYLPEQGCLGNVNPNRYSGTPVLSPDANGELPATVAAAVWPHGTHVVRQGDRLGIDVPLYG